MEKNDLGIFPELNSLIEKGDKDTVLRFLKTKKLTAKTYYSKVTSCLDIEWKCVTFAAKCGHDEIVDSLIELGFDPNEPGNHGFRPVRPIHLACEFGHLAVVKTLLENHGVKLDTKKGENPPLYLAVLNNKHDVYKYLIEEFRAPVNITCGVQRNSLLHVAINNEDLDLCKMLIDHGIKIDTPNAKKVTPLLLALNKSPVEFEHLLLDAGANVNVKDKKGDTPILSAVCRDDYDAVKLLSSYGADPEIPDKHGNTSLHMAVYNNRYNITRYFICDLNVPLHTKNKMGMTAFGYAVQHELFPIMYLFINAGYMAKEVLDLRVENFSMVAEWLNHFGKFQEVVFTPRTLQELACFKIRHILGRRLPKSVRELPVQENLQQRLLLEYIPEKGRRQPVAT